MYLHSLTLTNIGPFRGTTEIGLSDLGQSGLFLLDGPTGSGKSTLLDSIVFALYGQVGTSHANNERMRSNLAEPHEVSEVDLIFEVESGVYRVLRSPAYERAKKSGSGTTKNQASVKLWRLTSPQHTDGELLSTRHGEAEQEIQSVIGLTREQFVQTVLLPQGDFATFLRANAEDRRALLQRLFATDLYEKMAAELDAARRSGVQELTVAETVAQGARLAYLTTIGPAAENFPEADDLSEVRTAISAIAAGIKAEQEVAALRVRELTTRLDAATGKLNELEEKQRTVLRVIDLRSRQAQLLQHADAIAGQRTLLASLRNVAAIAPTHDLLRSSEQSLARVSHQIEVAKTGLKQLHEDQLAAPMETVIALRATIAELSEALETERLLDAEFRRSDILNIDISKAEERIAQLETALAQLPDQIEAARDRLHETTKLADRLPALETEVAQLANRHHSATELEALTTEIAKLKTQIEQTAADAHAAGERVASLTRARIEGIAGELAQSLQPGTGCPVCGSTEHPHPATSYAHIPSADEVQAAAHATSELTARLQDLRADYDALLAQKSTLAAGTAGMTVAEIDTLLAETETAFKAANLASTGLADLHKELEIKLNQQQAKAEERERTIAQLAQLRADLTGCTTTIKRYQADIQEARGEHPSVAQHIAELHETLSALSNYADLVIQAQEHRVDQAARQEQWAHTLAQFGIESDQHFIDLRAQVPAIDQLDKVITEHDAELAGVTEALREPQVIDLTDSDLAAQIEELKTTVNDLKAALQAGTEALGSLQTTASLATDRAQEFLDRLAEYHALAQEIAEVIALADIVNGSSASNLQRIPLPTYVLVSRFRDVVSAANSRLATMSDGRYSLEHTFAKERHGRKSGLGLIIRDHHTESDREPGNLSGGESFYTSLALALGLADVVCSEAGGLRLSTLFIDEGFGALDSATLDNVLTEISRLREGGRVVGLVSHVEELKQRILDRISVIPSGSGHSSVRVVV